MNLYLKRAPGSSDQQKAVMVIGSGLIGAPIMHLLENENYNLAYRTKFQWGSHPQQESQINVFSSDTSELRISQMTIIWAAGATGFGSSSNETSAEFEDFKSILERLRSHYQQLGVSLRIILISSAGGLFEGQRLVRQNTTPHPLRPYGTLKFDQEQFVATLNGVDHYLFLRLTSAFGKISPCYRMGLIPTLLYNGLRNQVSYIAGRQDTIRDYVYVDNVASAAVRCIDCLPEMEMRSVNLASFKPSSLLEIQQCVETTIQRKLYINYTDDSNSASISFSDQTKFSYFMDDGLNANVAKIYHAFTNN